MIKKYLWLFGVIWLNDSITLQSQSDFFFQIEKLPRNIFLKTIECRLKNYLNFESRVQMSFNHKKLFRKFRWTSYLKQIFLLLHESFRLTAESDSNANANLSAHPDHMKKYFSYG